MDEDDWFIMMIGDYCSYGLVAVLCFLCIISDIRNGIIPNRYLALYGGIAVLIHVINTVIYPPESPVGYLLTVAIAISISLLLYFSKTWAGGDCKLYIVLVCAMPVSVVQTEIGGVSLIIWLSVVAFLIGYLYLIVNSFRELIFSSHNKTYENNTCGKKHLLMEGGRKIGKRFFEYIKVFFFLTFFNYFFLRMLSFLTENINGIVAIKQVVPDVVWHIGLFLIDISMLYIVRKYKVLSSKWVLVAFVIADMLLGIIDVAFFLDPWNYLIWISICITWMIKDLVEKYNYEELELTRLQRGMILSTGSSILFSSLDQTNTIRISDESLKYRLSDPEINKILMIGKKNPRISSVEIVRKVPFAVFLSVAALLIIIYEGGM